MIDRQNKNSKITVNPITHGVEILRTRATSIAQSCPVCNSFGSLKYGTIRCHGCDGKGYVLIPAEEI